MKWLQELKIDSLTGLSNLVSHDSDSNLIKWYEIEDQKEEFQ